MSADLDELAHLPFSLRSKIATLDAKEASLRAFAAQLADAQRKLERKAAVVAQVIDRRVEQHHALLDKWRARWKTTVSESIDEKRERLQRQHARFERKCAKMADFRASLRSMSGALACAPASHSAAEFCRRKRTQ